MVNRSLAFLLSLTSAGALAHAQVTSQTALANNKILKQNWTPPDTGRTSGFARVLGQ